MSEGTATEDYSNEQRYAELVEQALYAYNALKAANSAAASSGPELLRKLSNSLPDVSSETGPASIITDNDLRDDDVVCGRDKFAQTYIGNQRLLDIIEFYRKEYPRTTERRGEKTRFISRIVAIIARNGGRFLKRDENNYWVEIDAAARHERVSNSLRKAFVRGLRRTHRKSKKSLSSAEMRQAAKEYESARGLALMSEATPP
jgi:hypothetical protein